MKRFQFCTLLVVCSALLAAGPVAVSAGDHDHDHAEESHAHCDHAHSAPHGGTLVPLGDHVGHVELMLDAEDGTVRLYVLGGHAEKSVRIADHTLTIDLVSVDGHEVSAEPLVLNAVASLLTGETIGDTSEFAASHAALVGAQRFDGRLTDLTMKGVTFADIKVAGVADAGHQHHNHSEHGHDH